MDDITLPNESARDDDDAFYIRPVKEKVNVDFEKVSIEDARLEADFDDGSSAAGNLPSTVPSDQVRIHFSKFVQLVANHSYIDIVDKNANQEVIISSNLLTDLANAHDRIGERRMPLIFMAGLVIGIILTYIIVR
ncbi:MAG: hypothetical protein Q8P27_02550 [Candidatus Peregrinibacteria bacterium]|nr:hypothetical protein [Candidatus Peregrinibacteria bacterium]